MTTIGPDKVSGPATHPWHRALLGWAGVALLVWVAAATTLPTIPDEGTPPSLSASACEAALTAESLPEGCAEVLPPTLQGLPTPQQYEDGRLQDFVQRVDTRARDRLTRSSSPLFRRSEGPKSLEEVLDGARTHSEEDVERQLLGVARSLDPIGRRVMRERRQAELDPGVRLPRAPRVSMLGGLLVERDWSQVQRPAPPAPMPTELPTSFEDSREATPVVISVWEWARWSASVALADEMAERYATHRAEALTAWWVEQEAEQQAAFEAAGAARRRAEERRSTQLVMSGISFVGMWLLVVGWVRTRPRTITLTPHVVRLGDREIHWEHVSRVDWRGREGWIRTIDGEEHDLGPLQIPADLRVALEEATLRARERRRALAPLDADALEEAQRLVR